MGTGLTPQEIEARWNRITGSTVATYLGENPWESPVDAWIRNRDRIVEPPNPAMEIGLAVEDGLARVAARWLDIPGPMVKPSTIYHLKHGTWWCCHPDFVFPVAQMGMQVKNHSPHMRAGFLGRPGERGRWDNNLVPIHHLMQCLWEMGAVGWGQWVLVVYFGGADLRCYRIKRDSLVLERIERAAFAFWRKYLDPAGPREQPSLNGWHRGGTDVPPRSGPRLSQEELLAAPIPLPTSQQGA